MASLLFFLFNLHRKPLNPRGNPKKQKHFSQSKQINWPVEQLARWTVDEFNARRLGPNVREGRKVGTLAWKRKIILKHSKKSRDGWLTNCHRKLRAFFSAPKCSSPEQIFV